MTKEEKPWWAPAAELMAREGLTLAESVTRLGVAINTIEARNTFRSAQFQRLLLTTRNRHFREVGTNAEWSKKTAVGQLLECAAALFARGEFDKCAEVILKATKIEGWVGEAGNVNVFAGMTGRDLDQIRAKLQERKDQEAKAN
jgi:hypothetical protein